MPSGILIHDEHHVGILRLSADYGISASVLKILLGEGQLIEVDDVGVVPDLKVTGSSTLEVRHHVSERGRDRGKYEQEDIGTAEKLTWMHNHYVCN